jgi:hypothetical protein
MLKLIKEVRYEEFLGSKNEWDYSSKQVDLDQKAKCS